MKKTLLFKNIFLGYIFSYSLISAAQNTTSIEHCDTNKLNEIKYSQCLDTVKNKVERELETWVNNQTFILEEVAKSTGRTSTLDIFKRSQKNFITFRENNCKWQFLLKLPSSHASSSFKKCYIMVNKSRIKELSNINN